MKYINYLGNVGMGVCKLHYNSKIIAATQQRRGAVKGDHGESRGRGKAHKA